MLSKLFPKFDVKLVDWVDCDDGPGASSRSVVDSNDPDPDPDATGIPASPINRFLLLPEVVESSPKDRSSFRRDPGAGEGRALGDEVARAGDCPTPVYICLLRFLSGVPGAEAGE